MTAQDFDLLVFLLAPLVHIVSNQLLGLEWQLRDPIARCSYLEA